MTNIGRCFKVWPSVLVAWAHITAGGIAQETRIVTGPAKALPLKGEYKAPQWSPDGQWLGFTTPRFEGIYVVRPDGSGFRRLTDAPRAGYRFAWSPDGRQLMFASTEADGLKFRHAIQLMTLEDGRSTTILQRETGLGLPQWAGADSLRVVVDGRLAVVDLKGEVRSAPTSKIEAHSPAITAAPTAEDENAVRVAYCDDQDHDRVVILEPSGRRETLTDAGAGRFYDPSWSPGGDRLLVHDLNGHLYLLNPETKDRQDLGAGLAGKWSPDGRHILCNTSHDDGYILTGADIVVIDSISGARSEITRTPDRFEMYPAWSADGRRVAYGDARTGSLFIQAIEPGGRP